MFVKTKPTHRSYRPRFETLEDRWTPASLPLGFAEAPVASGLILPTAMEFAPDGRLFIAEQTGNLRVFAGGFLRAAPFLTLDVNSDGERGLLGVAVDPNYLQNHFVYVYYTTAASPIHNRVSRFVADNDLVVPGSEVVLMDLENLGATNHNGGSLHFGTDGKLYIGVGENAVPSNSQTLGNRLGKLLRINSDGSIPTDNPFFATATGVNRAIWALGLRNPFTFAVQAGSNNHIFINDVGQSAWEEINEGSAGANYGWPNTEGPTTDSTFRGPYYAYMHGNTAETGNAITGGTFYNPATVQFPQSYVGSYFFADLTSGWIRRIPPPIGGVTGFATGINQPVDLDVGPDGQLYYLSHGDGTVFRIRGLATDLNFAGTWVNAPSSATTQTTFQVQRTYNISSNAVNPNFFIRYYASSDATFGNSDDLLVGTEFITAAADKTAGVHRALTPPLRIGRAGAHYLFTYLDASGSVEETREFNNLYQSTIQIQVTGKADVIVDTFDPGYQESVNVGHAYYIGYGGQIATLNPGVDPRSASWTVLGIPNGTYDVKLTWPVQGNAATDAPFRVFDGTTQRTLVTINQRVAPTGTLVNGFRFQTIARVTVTTGTLRVSLTNDSSNFVVADAVQFVQV